jgi:hypothetical protein
LLPHRISYLRRLNGERTNPIALVARSPTLRLIYVDLTRVSLQLCKCHRPPKLRNTAPHSSISEISFEAEMGSQRGIGRQIALVLLPQLPMDFWLKRSLTDGFSTLTRVIVRVNDDP